MVPNAIVNNISAISWRSVLLVEETGKNIDLPQVTDKYYHLMLYRVHIDITLVLIGTGCCNLTNYHTITTTTASHAEWPSWLIVIQSQVRKYIHMYFTRLWHHPGSVLIILVPAVHTLYLLPKKLEQELLIIQEHLRSPRVFSGVRVTRSLVLCVFLLDRCLSFCTFSFGRWVVCSSIYGFCLRLWYLQLFLKLPSQQYFILLWTNNIGNLT